MTLTPLFSIASPVTLLFAASFGLCIATAPGQAAEKAAVFEFELAHGDLAPGTPDKHEAEEKRLEMVSDLLRDRLAGSGQFEVVDIAPVAQKAAAANLQACGNCADSFAREVGASYAFTGVVHKVSELVLSINVYVHDATTSQPVTSASVDIRGNTDESWRRGTDYLYENVLLPRLERLKK